MYNNSIQKHECEDFGNGWGLYIDIENTSSLNNKVILIKPKYNTNYYNNCYDKIDEELEYYEYEYNKKQEQIKQLEEEAVSDIIKTNSSSLLFHISSLTLITAAVSYCFLFGL